MDTNFHNVPFLRGWATLKINTSSFNLISLSQLTKSLNFSITYANSFVIQECNQVDYMVKHMNLGDSTI